MSRNHSPASMASSSSVSPLQSLSNPSHISMPKGLTSGLKSSQSSALLTKPWWKFTRIGCVVGITEPIAIAIGEPRPRINRIGAVHVAVTVVVDAVADSVPSGFTASSASSQSPERR